MANAQPACLITGANRGIGLELARQAAGRGYRVFATCRDPARAQALAAAAGESGGAIDILACDVTDAASVAALKRSLGDTPLAMLINNAGIMGADPQSATTMDFDTLTDVLDVNVTGVLRVTQALLPNVAAARGKVAVISSTMAQFGYASSSRLAYCISKTAITRAFTMLASDVKRDGVTVAILSPGWVKTDMGGASAPLSAGQSARGLLDQIEAWSLQDSGTFRDHAGNAMDW